jgi:hypothetical protein
VFLFNSGFLDAKNACTHKKKVLREEENRRGELLQSFRQEAGHANGWFQSFSDVFTTKIKKDPLSNNRRRW